MLPALRRRRDLLRLGSIISIAVDVCGLIYERNPGDTWAFTILGDRLPVAAMVVIVYFGVFRVASRDWFRSLRRAGGGSFSGRRRTGGAWASRCTTCRARCLADPDDPIPASDLTRVPLSQRRYRATPALTMPIRRDRIEPGRSCSNAANAASTSRFARSSRSGSAGSIGRSPRSARCSWRDECLACRRSSIDSGEPQCEQPMRGEIDRAAAVGAVDRLHVAAQLVDLLAESGRMKFFSRRKSKNVVNRPWSCGQRGTRTHVALHVVRRDETRPAARTLRGRDGGGGRRRPRAHR